MRPALTRVPRTVCDTISCVGLGPEGQNDKVLRVTTHEGSSTVAIEVSIIGPRPDLTAGIARPERYVNMARAGTSRSSSSGSPGAGRPCKKKKGAVDFHDPFPSSYNYLMI